MEFTKTDIARLADVDHTLVRIELNACYRHVPASAKNAIEQVRALGDYSFKEALEFLQNVSESSDLTLQHLEPANVPPTDLEWAAERVCKSEIIRQLGAIDAHYYRLTALDLNGVTTNLGKTKSGRELVFTQKDIISKIPQLRLLNNVEGKNIIITPLDTTAYYVLLDDATAEANNARLLQRAGYRPCLVQKSSPKSTQVVFKIPKMHREFSPDYEPNKKTPARFARDREDVNAYFVALNRHFGDEKITGLRHGFRLAGFRNLKEKYRFDEDKFPFVEILHAENVFCEKTAHLARNRLVESKIIAGGEAAGDLVQVYTSKQRKLVRRGGVVQEANPAARAESARLTHAVIQTVSRERRGHHRPRRLTETQIKTLIRAKNIAGSITEPAITRISVAPKLG